MATQSTFVDATLGGVNMTGGATSRTPVSIFNGDALRLGSRVRLLDGTPVSPSNCDLRFVVSDNRFGDPLIELGWSDGIKLHDKRDGWIQITIPADVTATLRRGSYIYSLQVIQDASTRFVAFDGSFLVDYAPTSPLRRPGYATA